METSIRTSRRTRRSPARRLDDRYRSIRPSPRPTTIRCQKTKPAITLMYTSPYYDRPITRTQRWDILPAYVSYTHAARSFCSLANVNVNKRKQSNAGAETTSRRIFKVKKKNHSSSCMMRVRTPRRRDRYGPFHPAEQPPAPRQRHHERTVRGAYKYVRVVRYLPGRLNLGQCI